MIRFYRNSKICNIEQQSANIKEYRTSSGLKRYINFSPILLALTFEAINWSILIHGHVQIPSAKTYTSTPSMDMSVTCPCMGVSDIETSIMGNMASLRVDKMQIRIFMPEACGGIDKTRVCQMDILTSWICWGHNRGIICLSIVISIVTDTPVICEPNNWYQTCTDTAALWWEMRRGWNITVLR